MIGRLFLVVALLVACASPEPWVRYELRFPSGFEAADRSAVLQGAAAWSRVDWEIGPDYDGAPEGGPAVVFVEIVSSSDPTATLNPTWVAWTTMSADTYQLIHFVLERWFRAPAIVAHELGHAMGIHHLSERGSLMSEIVEAGGPTPEDWDAFCQIHPCPSRAE